jgi:DNA-binding NarL/FixJ family response regulator
MTRILLADDHAMMREGLATILGAAGMTVVGAVGDGREAVRAARELTPDVVVMDASMPELNGIEAARDILAHAPAVQVVMLSMHASREHVHQAFAAGATGYVLKDSAGAEVVAAVRAVCAGRRYVSPALGTPPESEERGPLESLSKRERQVLQLVVEGRTSAQIAERLHLSPKSVDTYRSRLMHKLEVPDLPALVKFAVQHGLTPPG